MGSYGIDVSNNNGRISLTALKPSFVFAKCTEETKFTDPDYGYYAAEAEAADAQFGAYHFGHPELMDSRAEAEHFMATARPRSFLSMWYDYEIYGTSAESDAEEIGLFIETCKVIEPKVKIGLYANLDGYSRITPHLGEVPADAIWLAYWSGPPAVIAGHPAARWNVHQYAIDDGISRDYSNWSAEQMRAFWAWE